METDLKVTVKLNIEAVRAAVMNASKLQDVAFEIPVVDPTKLTMDSKIYGFELVPVDDQVKTLKNDDARCIAIKEISVDNLSKTMKAGFITVNSNYELPLNMGSMVKIGEAYVANKADAIEIARISTEVELERAMKVLSTHQEIVDFLTEQLDKERF
jgi:hypothetical protein